MDMKNIKKMMVKPNTGMFKPTGKALINNVNFPSIVTNRKAVTPNYGMTQKEFLRKTKGNAKSRFTDHDKDGVISGLDCMPGNKKKHNLEQELEEEEVEDEDEETEGRPLPQEQQSAASRKAMIEKFGLQEEAKIQEEEAKIKEEKTKLEMEEVKAKQKKARIDIGHPVERSKGLFGNIKSYAKERYEEKKAEISKGVSKKLGYAYEAPETRKMYKQVDIQEGLDKAKAEARISGIAKARISEIEQKYKPNAKDKTIENNKFFLTRQQQTMALQKEVKHKKQADTQIQKLAQYSLFKAQGEVSKLRAEKAKAIAGTRAKYREMKSKYPTNQGNLFGSNMVSSRQTMPPTQQPSLGGYLISKNQSQDKPKKDIRDLMFF